MWNSDSDSAAESAADTDAGLHDLIRSQLGLITVAQALRTGMTPSSIKHRIACHGWSRPLPGLLLTSPVDLTKDQRLVAAALWLGGEGMIDAEDACGLNKFVTVTPDAHTVRTVVPQGSPRRDRGFVTVRRTDHPICCGGTALGVVRYLGPADAAVAAAARQTSADRATAILSEATRKSWGTAAVLEALGRAPRRRQHFLDGAMAAILGGTRTLGEARFRALALGRSELPPLNYNWLIRLPSGKVVSPDALAPDAPLIHEVLGHEVHGAERAAFAETIARSDDVVEAGFTVLGNTPERVRDDGPAAIQQFVTVYLPLQGRGWPPGVTVLRAGPPEAGRPRQPR